MYTYLNTSILEFRACLFATLWKAHIYKRLCDFLLTMCPCWPIIWGGGGRRPRWRRVARKSKRRHTNENLQSKQRERPVSPAAFTHLIRYFDTTSMLSRSTVFDRQNVTEYFFHTRMIVGYALFVQCLDDNPLIDFLFYILCRTFCPRLMRWVIQYFLES